MKKKYYEGQASHSESINQLADQIKKFILKHKDSPNATVNSFAIGIFLGFSEAFAEDGDPDTNGLNMLSRMVDKVKVLMKEYEDLVPEENEDFNLTDNDIEDMETTLDSDTDEESEEEYDEEDEEESDTTLDDEESEDESEEDEEEDDVA
jgi:hypothetical protein